MILSTADVKGKTSPCGCHTPKGGFARRASFADSVRSEYSQVMLVDGGGFFPETDPQRDAAGFMMEAMNMLGTDAVGCGDKELHFGLAFLKDNVQRTKLRIVCANLLDRKTHKPIFAPSLIKKVGNLKVGVFGLMSDKADAGPGRDSIEVSEPSAVARQTVADLRRKGATVIVLLSQLGKAESEDLVTAVDGIDALIVGWGAPMLQKGRLIKNTVACYGGEQGWYVGRTILDLDARGHMTTGDNETFMLGPEVGEKQPVLATVKRFEDALNEKLRKEEKEQAARQSLQQSHADNPDRYLGAEFCARCHTPEFEQWKTTGHSNAWQALVDVKKDATPECVTCHVVGYQQAGGFQTGDDVKKLANVQCENCHGMGTQHDSWPAQAQRVTEATCRTCHTATTSPVFDFAVFEPHIRHHPPADMKPLPPKPAGSSMMTAH